MLLPLDCKLSSADVCAANIPYDLRSLCQSDDIFNRRSGRTYLKLLSVEGDLSRVAPVVDGIVVSLINTFIAIIESHHRAIITNARVGIGCSQSQVHSLAVGSNTIADHASSPGEEPAVVADRAQGVSHLLGGDL
jgi:hypothetical protein